MRLGNWPSLRAQLSQGIAGAEWSYCQLLNEGILAMYIEKNVKSVQGTHASRDENTIDKIRTSIDTVLSCEVDVISKEASEELKNFQVMLAGEDPRDGAYVEPEEQQKALDSFKAKVVEGNKYDGMLAGAIALKQFKFAINWVESVIAEKISAAGKDRSLSLAVTALNKMSHKDCSWALADRTEFQQHMSQCINTMRAEKYENVKYTTRLVGFVTTTADYGSRITAAMADHTLAILRCGQSIDAAEMVFGKIKELCNIAATVDLSTAFTTADLTRLSWKDGRQVFATYTAHRKAADSLYAMCGAALAVRASMQTDLDQTTLAEAIKHFAWLDECFEVLVALPSQSRAKDLDAAIAEFKTKHSLKKSASPLLSEKLERTQRCLYSALSAALEEQTEAAKVSAAGSMIKNHPSPYIHPDPVMGHIKSYNIKLDCGT